MKKSFINYIFIIFIFLGKIIFGITEKEKERIMGIVNSAL